MNKLIKGLLHPGKIVVAIGRKTSLVPDRLYLKAYYKNIFGRKLNLKNPVTFNEKIQWLKLYDRKPEYTTMVDKYAAKDYVAQIIGDEYIIPTLGVYDSFDEIDFDALPQQFVLKCTHDSGRTVIVKDKNTFDKELARKKLEKYLKTNYYLSGREWPYKNVPRRILAEKYMEDSKGKGDLTDYKIHCFNGEPRAVQVISNRFGQENMRNDYYTLNWENYGLRRGHYNNAKVQAKRPEQLEEMLQYARILSDGLPFIRVDFYIINGKIYFGELTFYPASGFNPFTPEAFDDLFGEWIKLPIDNVDEKL